MLGRTPQKYPVQESRMHCWFVPIPTVPQFVTIWASKDWRNKSQPKPATAAAPLSPTVGFCSLRVLLTYEVLYNYGQQG